MFYRENGQFKTSYKADQQIFPIAQDRWGVLLIIAFAFLAVPFMADEYMMRAILIPFLILSLAASSRPSSLVAKPLRMRLSRVIVERVRERSDFGSCVHFAS